MPRRTRGDSLDGIRDPVVYLARRVIAEAMVDLEAGHCPRCANLATDRERLESLGYKSLATSLKVFFAGPILEYWCILGNLDIDAVRERAEVVRKRRRLRRV